MLARALLLLALVAPEVASACSCIAPDPETPRQAAERKFAAHPLVIVASVKRTYRRRLFVDGRWDWSQFAEISTRRVFKGQAIPNQRFRIELGGYGTSCEVDAEVGEEWLIYADPEKPMLISFCNDATGSLPGMLDEVAELVRMTLGGGKKPD